MTSKEKMSSEVERCEVSRSYIGPSRSLALLCTQGLGVKWDRREFRTADNGCLIAHILHFICHLRHHLRRKKGYGSSETTSFIRASDSARDSFTLSPTYPRSELRRIQTAKIGVNAQQAGRRVPMFRRTKKRFSEGVSYALLMTVPAMSAKLRHRRFPVTLERRR